jgi:tetratricopeptide (TPR) repeat protein
MRRGFLACLLLLVTASAWAQDMDRARRRFEAGSQAFDKRDYAKAELEFRAAYAITKDAVLWYNIGQSQQGRGHLEAAIKSYRAYLAGVPNAEDRAEVEGIIRSIQKRLAPKAEPPRPPVTPLPVTPPPVAPPPVAPPPVTTPPVTAAPTSPVETPTSAPATGEGRGRRQAAWITAGASAALLVVGVAMVAVAAGKVADANRLIDQRDPVTGQPVPFAGVQGQFDAAKSGALGYGGVALGMFAAAAVGAGVAVYLFVSSRPKSLGRERSQARLRLLPALDHRNAGLVAGMEF